MRCAMSPASSVFAREPGVARHVGLGHHLTGMNQKQAMPQIRNTWNICESGGASCSSSECKAFEDEGGYVSANDVGVIISVDLRGGESTS
jgi:hypothetical protein